MPRPTPDCRCCRACCIRIAGCSGSGCCLSPASISFRPGWSDDCEARGASRFERVGLTSPARGGEVGFTRSENPGEGILCESQSVEVPLTPTLSPRRRLSHSHIFCPQVCIGEKSESFQRSVSNLHRGVCETGGHLSPCI